jgi:phosphosulfolactate synthase (CoM biosynthesis protein A)
MKWRLIVLVLMLGFTSIAWGGPSVRQVEVVNEYLDIGQPVDVNVVNYPGSVQHQYVVVRASSDSAFEDALNQQSALGFELVSFGVIDVNNFVMFGVMRKPVP